MIVSWIRRIGMLAAVVVPALVASPAMAEACKTLPLNQGQRGVTAPALSDKGCDLGPTGIPRSGQDVWVFVLPGKGEFTQLTVKFGNGDVINTLSIPGSSESAIVSDQGTSKAWIAVPAGWTLLDASATVTASATKDFFNLTHTCPASGGGTPEQGGGGQPSQPATGESTSPVPSTGSSPSATPGTASSSRTPGASGGSLPVTGVPAAAIGGLGLATLAAGGLVVALLR